MFYLEIHEDEFVGQSVAVAARTVSGALTASEWIARKLTAYRRKKGDEKKEIVSERKYEKGWETGKEGQLSRSSTSIW